MDDDEIVVFSATGGLNLSDEEDGVGDEEIVVFSSNGGVNISEFEKDSDETVLMQSMDSGYPHLEGEGARHHGHLGGFKERQIDKVSARQKGLALYAF